MAQSTEIKFEVAEDRPWRCASGAHILGVVRRINKVNQLYLASGDVITGAARLWCPTCLAHREWHTGQDALERLLQRRGISETT